LNLRRNFNQLFIEGEYLPLEVNSNDMIAMAYARHYADKWLVVIVPLGKRDNNGSETVSEGFIQLPENSPDHWTNAITGETLQTQRKLLLSRCLATFPIAALTNLYVV
jgi:(1->4)-alpha-D-glucan 1-alpha-D-glucosylmutase